VALTTLKIAVLAPIPKVRVANTVKAIRGDFRIDLSENWTSFQKLICTPRRTIEGGEIWLPATPVFNPS
jgi:hypothetical protein